MVISRTESAADAQQIGLTVLQAATILPTSACLPIPAGQPGPVRIPKTG